MRMTYFQGVYRFHCVSQEGQEGWVLGLGLTTVARQMAVRE